MKHPTKKNKIVHKQARIQMASIKSKFRVKKINFLLKKKEYSRNQKEELSEISTRGPYGEHLIRLEVTHRKPLLAQKKKNAARKIAHARNKIK